ncbi:MAG: hypothetical protein GQ551_07290 [Myxococcales bacterium]|nr:hypothetical protein [Myxococcales bacterium]
MRSERHLGAQHIPQLRDGTVAGSPEYLAVAYTYRRPDLLTDKERSKTLLLGATP